MTAVDAAQAYRFILMSVDYTPLQILMPMIPDVLFVLIFGWVIVRLTMKRSSRVVAEAVAVIWVLGPDRDTGVVFLLPDPGPQCDGALRLILLRARRNGLPRVLRPCGADLRNPTRPLTQAAQGFR